MFLCIVIAPVVDAADAADTVDADSGADCACTIPPIPLQAALLLADHQLIAAAAWAPTSALRVA